MFDDAEQLRHTLHLRVPPLPESFDTDDLAIRVMSRGDPPDHVRSNQSHSPRIRGLGLLLLGRQSRIGALAVIGSCATVGIVSLVLAIIAVRRGDVTPSTTRTAQVQLGGAPMGDTDLLYATWVLYAISDESGTVESTPSSTVELTIKDSGSIRDNLGDSSYVHVGTSTLQFQRPWINGLVRINARPLELPQSRFLYADLMAGEASWSIDDGMLLISKQGIGSAQFIQKGSG